MNILRKHRYKRQFTLRKMAAKLGISIGALSAYENNKIQMSVKTALKIEAIIKIPASKLLKMKIDKCELMCIQL